MSDTLSMMYDDNSQFFPFSDELTRVGSGAFDGVMLTAAEVGGPPHFAAAITSDYTGYSEAMERWYGTTLYVNQSTSEDGHQSSPWWILVAKFVSIVISMLAGSLAIWSLVNGSYGSMVYAPRCAALIALSTLGLLFGLSRSRYRNYRTKSV